MSMTPLLIGIKRNSRMCIGKLYSENGEIIYNRRFKERQSDNIKPGPVATTTHQRRFHGATYLFDKISEQLGIKDDLKSCFPDTYKQILSIAYYLILEDRNLLSRFAR